MPYSGPETEQSTVAGGEGAQWWVATDDGLPLTAAAAHSLSPVSRSSVAGDVTATTAPVPSDARRTAISGCGQRSSACDDPRTIVLTTASVDWTPSGCFVARN